MDTFNDYAYYYNMFYQDKGYAAEAAQIDLLMKKYGTDVTTLINFGCGTGKHDIEFTRLGYQCTGIDVSSSMIDIAQKNAKQENMHIDFEVKDIRMFMPRSKYDAVISLFHVMSYQTQNDDILLAFKSARKSLRYGGLFLFDVWYGPGVLSDRPSVRVKEVEDEQNRLLRVAQPIMHESDNVVDVCYEIFVIQKITRYTKIIKETHSMRYFFRPELEWFLKNAGFELIENLDCVTLEKTSFNSWTSYFIARAV